MTKMLFLLQWLLIESDIKKYKKNVWTIFIELHFWDKSKTFNCNNIYVSLILEMKRENNCLAKIKTLD